MIEDSTLFESGLLFTDTRGPTPERGCDELATASPETTSQIFSPIKTLLEVIKNFPPAWFAISMGTGVVSIIFHSYPYGTPSNAMNILSLIFFFIDLIIFVLFFAMSIARYTLFPGSWTDMLQHPVQSLYLGCFPMGAATLINIGLGTVNQYFAVGGAKFLYALWAFWWLDSLISFLCCFGVIYVMSGNLSYLLLYRAAHRRHSMPTFTAIWLLPIVPVIVASTTGQLLSSALAVHSILHARLTMGVSLLMVVIGLSLFFMILTLYLRRLIIEGLPDVNAIIFCILPLAPCGQGGYSLLIAGLNAQTLLPKGEGYILGDPLAGQAISFICFAGAWTLWAMAVWWLGCALCAIVHNLAKGEHMPFTLSFWGLVFPNGVAALLTIQLGTAMDANFFRVLGAIHGAAVVLMWVVLVGPTLIHVWNRRIFVAPASVSSNPMPV